MRTAILVGSIIISGTVNAPSLFVGFWLFIFISMDLAEFFERSKK